MARRKARKGAKIQPAVKSLFFGSVPVGTSYIDLSLAASIVNRRFYRQGLNWAVAGFTFHTTQGNAGRCFINKIPDTWISSNAWHKSFLMWQKMNDQILDDQPSVKPRYLDFKVNMDYNMSQSGALQTTVPAVNNDILLPTFSDGALPTPGEWTYSQLTIPNDPGSGAVTDWDIHFVGADGGPGTSKGLIDGYSLSRARPNPNEPNVVDQSVNQGWMTLLFDDGDQLPELLENLQNDNDSPPYPVGNPGSALEYYPGSATQLASPSFHAKMETSATTIGGTTQVRGSTFQCGLIQLSNDIENLSVQVHLVPGPHRGYMCQKMQDV